MWVADPRQDQEISASGALAGSPSPAIRDLKSPVNYPPVFCIFSVVETAVELFKIPEVFAV